MVFCSRCGAENEKDALYCKSCGASLRPPSRRPHRRRYEDNICFGTGTGTPMCGFIIGALVIMVFFAVFAPSIGFPCGFPWGFPWIPGIRIPPQFFVIAIILFIVFVLSKR